jgi:GT2 family glycosyltransferase
VLSLSDGSRHSRREPSKEENLAVQPSSTGTTIGVEDLPVFLTEIELSEPLPAVTAQPVDGVVGKKMRALVRLRYQPIGYVILPTPSVSPETVATSIWDQLCDQIRAYFVDQAESPPESLSPAGLGRDRSTEPTDLPFMSVVVATRDRPEKVGRVLATLAALDYPSFEVVVVENGPSNERTRSAVAATGDDRFRYVHEQVPGTSRGRNRGIYESSGEIVVFVDDDVRVDGWYLRAIAQGFRRADNVGCVTGMVSPVALNTVAELYVDQRLAWAASLKPRTFDLRKHRDDSALYPYSAGIFGTGGNCALRRAALDRIGGFDEALGPGTRSGGGEDLDIFLRVVRVGYSLVREPAAIVHHEHYKELSVLHRQMFSYGRGFTAYLTKHLLRPRTAIDIVSRIPRGIAPIMKAKNGAKALGVVPPSIAGREFRGMFFGPFAYLESAYRLHRSVRAGKHPDLFA